MTTPRLSIIIVSYNCRADLDRCLISLRESGPDMAHEVVVVDNASADGTPAHLRARWPGVRLIETGGNVGFGPANNVGIRATSSDLVLFLNPDAVVPPRAIDRLAAALHADPAAAAAGPRLVDDAGRAELSWGPMMSPLGELRQKILVRGHTRGVPIIAALVERMTRRSRAVDWVSGACLLVHRRDLEAVGLFDERLFLYTEDVDLCASLRAQGRRILFVSDVEVIHHKGRSGAHAPEVTRAAYHRSHLAFYEKHHPRWAPLLKAYLKIR